MGAVEPDATAAIYGAINLLTIAAVDRLAYRRLVALLALAGALFALGCVLGVVWRIQWPSFPELHIPVSAF